MTVVGLTLCLFHYQWHYDSLTPLFCLGFFAIYSDGYFTALLTY